jgi:thiamine-phosphate pyrophosphorylase
MPSSPLPLFGLFGLYGMADASAGDPLELGAWLIDRGVCVVQVRAKRAARRELVEVARALVAHAAGTRTRVLVNDDPVAAARAGAHGVHLGQDDGDVSAARALLGPDAWIGRSTHDLDQVRAASGVDYLGFGPVFETQTKAAAGDARGTARLAEAVAATPLPVVAIGGITAARLPAVEATGVAAWAVVSGLWGASDRGATFSALMGSATPLT